MAPHGFWQYAKLKLVVTLIRILNYMGTRRHLKPSAECRRTAVRIPSRQHRRFIKAWLYYPPDYNDNNDITINTTTKDNTLNEPRGVVINWHGGGYVMSNLGMDHAFCERIARDVRVLVLDADHRKGPEHPYPSAVEDAEDVLLVVCSGDVLAPEAEALGRRLREARGGGGGGGNVQTVMVQGAAHGFDKTVKPDLHDKEKTEMAYATVVRSLRAVMSKDC
ncbi:Alpha/beta hydrolase fold-3 [Moelleriella libera RCEF 2490]|uniref:Alpha/beta hydrolase fold-3 n=1 Tax=Moelleriella libera RCEF 2490 TaxID=1081109 RepID=A0A168E978_9HYPO|nr:Alpha/beta hydrolase fold-3 [Moelleriella libera RCEF 2490]